ncbi:hypothetical protein [Pseudovibrio denitrificans]|uniref:hypothetical protein n=1 Tax=Pseudovibrio denitrificans TaxID=258256 RepID=UPI001AD8E5EA|nr:hypothetical protein [Pseudovibrio denitrificans]
MSDLEVIWSDHGGTCPIPTRTLVASDLLLSIGPSPDREFDQTFQRISGALVLAMEIRCTTVVCGLLMRLLSQSKAS